MCGINGIYKKNSCPTDLNSDIVHKMNEKIIHRGPDDAGTVSKSYDNYSFAMGMRRLSIIDLKSGKQPIYSEDKTKVIIFNGEIYNYRELKSDLIEKGFSFETESDTEVILKLYEHYGEASLSMLDGMFAISIHDEVNDTILIARDFFGEKPLYYYSDDVSFLWGSELKSLCEILEKKPEINKKSLSLFFQLTYIPAPFTIYDNVHKLEGNKFIKIDCSTGNFIIKKIEKKDVSHEENASVSSFDDAKKRTFDLVQESVLSRSVSDVPIGTFLSGGVDSSIVSFCLAEQKSAPIDTFSIGFKKKEFDETDKSQTVAKLIGSKHHEFVIDDVDLEKNISSILLNFDEPFADSSALPTYMVSHLTSKHVKVALTGDGGDEVFGGYNKYYTGKFNNKYSSLVPESIHRSILKASNKLLVSTSDSRGLKFKIGRLLKAIDYEDNFYLNIVSLGFQENEMQSLIKSQKLAKTPFDYYDIGKPTTLSDFRNIDKILSLEGDMLVKVDRTSMMSSIECRAPFLNQKLWDFTMGLPDKYLMKGLNKKYLLKESFKEFFPHRFFEKSKQGFGVPVGDWLRTILKEELLSYIELKFLNEQNIFHSDFIRDMVFSHVDNKVDNTFRIWSFYCFQKWYIKTYEA